MLRRLPLFALLGAVVVGCKPRTSEYTFPEDYANAFCAKAEVCLFPELPNDRESCVEEMLPAIEYLEDECGDFDLSTAKNCLAEVRRMSCDDALPYEDVYQDPAACDQVYSCYGSAGSF